MVIPYTQSWGGRRGNFHHGWLQTVQQHAHFHEQERLKKMYDAAEGEDKEVLKRVLKKYGAYKLKL